MILVTCHKRIKSVLHNLIRERNSRNGNPVFTIILNGKRYKTKPDTAIGYVLTSADIGNEFIFELNKRNQIIAIKGSK